MTTIVISSGTTIVSTDIPATTNYLVENTATLEIATGGSLTSTTVDAGGLLDVLAGGIANDSTISGELTIYGTVDNLTLNAGGVAIVEAGGVVQGTVAAQGMLDYSDGLDNTGLLTIAGNAASLAVTGLLFNSGIIDVGAGASVTVDGTYQQKSLNGGPGPVLQLQVQGTGSGQYGSVAVTGTVDLRDSNALDILATPAQAAGSSLTIMTFTPGSLVGMFVSLTGSGGPSAGSGTSQNLGNGLTAGLLYDDSTGNIELEYVATPTTTADTWTAGATGDWATAAQWTSGMPTFYTDATIGANATVTLATDATVNSLTLDAGAALTTETGDGLSTVFLTVDTGAALTVNGEMTVDESTTSVLNNGAIEIAGPLLDINANVTGSGSFQIDPGATLEFEHLVEPTAISFNGPGGTLFVNTNPQLFSGTLVGFNTGGVLEVAEIITGVTVDHISGSDQKLVLTGGGGFTAAIGLNPHDDYSNTNFQITVNGSISTIRVLTPAVIAVTEVPSTGDLGAGQSDALTLTMNEQVTVTGTPTLMLNDGGTATYDPLKSTSTALVFDYTVATTDTNVPSLAANVIDLPVGAGIADAAGHALGNPSLTALPQVGPAIVAPTTFQHGAIATSGSLAGQYLWSTPANWTNGVPVNGGAAIIPDTLVGFDDISALSLTTLTEGGGFASVTVPVGTLNIGTLVSQVGSHGSFSFLAPDTNFLGLSAPAVVTVGTITGAGLGQFTAFGMNASFVDQSATDAGDTYIASTGGTIVLSPPPASASFLDFDSGTIAVEHPAASNATTLSNVTPGDVLELPGNSVTSANFGATSLTVTTNIGTYAFTNVTYASSVAGYSATFDPGLGLEAITFAAPTTFQHGAIATSGSLTGQYLWSNPANWTNGVPVNGGAAIIPDTLAGFDDIPALSLTALTEGGGFASVTVPVGALNVGTLVSQVGAHGSFSFLAPDTNFLGLSTPAVVTVGTIIGAGLGQFTAFGMNASFVDQSATDTGDTYIASTGGTIVLSPAPASASFLDFDSGTIALEHPAASNATTLSNVAPGDVLELPGNSVTSASFTATSLKVITNDGTYAFTDVSYASPVAGYTAAFDPTTGLEAITFSHSAVCFCSGTLILTDRGEVPVEALNIGDRAITLSHQARPITWIGNGRALVTRGRRSAATPIIVSKGALADNVPHHDLAVTKGHSLFLDGVLIPAEFLVNHRSIRWDDRAQEVTVYHVELDSHDVLLANGAPAESYRDDGNRWLFRNANTGWGLPPQAPCAPVLTGGGMVDAAWRRLLDRAGPRGNLPLTGDADLHLLVDGRRLDAVRRVADAHVYSLPDVPGTVRIVSHAAAPQELGLARDPRSLGVALRRIVVREGTRFRMIEASDASLGNGFHAFEAVNGFRWTDGDAAVPIELFAGFAGSVELVLTIASTAHYLEEGHYLEASVPRQVA
jgi:autotransporter passenger strand-loop-strand repeat protein